jgi:signal transduction histidine kinase
MRAMIRRALARWLARTPMRALLLRAFNVVLIVSFLLVGAAIGIQVYTHLKFSSAGQLAMHVEAAWWHAVPGSMPADALQPGRGHHRHRFVLVAKRDVSEVAPAVVREISTHPFFTARIVGVDGRILAAARNADLLPPPDMSAVDVHGTFFPPSRLVSTARSWWQVMTMPVVRDGRLVAVVCAGMDFGFQLRVMQALAVALLVTMLVALALAFGASTALSQVIVGPLERLATASKRLAAGDFSARSGLTEGRNEVMAVGASFDQMAACVQSSFAAQRRFVADASHELKTPLTAIGGMVDLLEIRADVDPGRREIIISTMALEVERMGRLVADLLTLSRAEQPSREPEDVDVAALLSDLVEEVRMRHLAHPIEFEGRGPCWVRAEPDALRRVFRNLLDNALAFSSAGSSVTVSAMRARDGSIEARVADRGIGIAVEDLPHVFDRFYRADRSRARSTGGTGLGLSIVRAIVEASGGTVGLESAAGEGTVAVVRLPSRG